MAQVEPQVQIELQMAQKIELFFSWASKTGIQIRHFVINSKKNDLQPFLAQEFLPKHEKNPTENYFTPITVFMHAFNSSF